MARLLVVAVLLGACIKPALVECPDGIACPVGDVCDDLHHGCVAPDQLTACNGLPEGADCLAGPTSGGCFDGVCLARGCGNHVVEIDEQCDDGNQVSNDGCRSDCLSNESCGNGVLDVGEACDDGNLMSRDGCDSRCLVEDITWSVVGIAPQYFYVHAFAYDAVRHRMVILLQRTTWEYDGTAWTMLRDNSILQGYIYFDPDRGRVVAVSSLDFNQPMGLYDWDGTRWAAVSMTNGPIDPVITATYDAARHRPVVLTSSLANGTKAWTVDGAGAWQALPDPGFGLVGTSSSAFDPTTNTVVVMISGAEYDWNGSSWSTTPRGFGSGGWAMAFNATSGHLALVDSATNTLRERQSNGSWSVVANGTVTCLDYYVNRERPIWFDNSVLSLMSTNASSVCEWTTTWTARIPKVPFSPQALVPDPANHRFVVLHSPDAAPTAQAVQSWAWDHGWSQLATAHTPTSRQIPWATYDLARKATILYGGYLPPSTYLGDTWAFDGKDWTQIAATGPAVSTFDGGFAYRPTDQHVVMLGGGMELELGATGSTWTSGTAPTTQPRSLAWHARSHHLLMSTTGSGVTTLNEETSTGVWTPLPLLPQGIYRVLGDLRTGGVLMFDLGNGTSWELQGQTWIKAPPVPIQTNGSTPALSYNPGDGSVAIMGLVSNVGPVLMIRQRTSATPLESCVAGEDVDGDGLAGCADPDCFWACGACPPYTSCL